MVKRQPKDTSKPAKTDEQGHMEPAQPSPDEQSGSTGRPTGGQGNDGKDSGQGRYGQSGFGGDDNPVPGAEDQPVGDGDGRRKRDSDPGSGRADRETQGVDNPHLSQRRKH